MILIYSIYRWRGAISQSLPYDPRSIAVFKQPLVDFRNICPRSF